ncbi:MAG: hypothetical protein LCI00_01620 [Chloroflexi bacterium]|nr:hypothetical protein [Chloroflexota bacterium]MCC6895609.1 hypothetical protein [Anaerolineae bacterium]
MGSVINTDSTGKQRSQIMRTVAEILRRLSQKQVVDDEVRNMTAMLVYLFREIEAGIEQSATAWEKRDYWVKSEELRQRWMWVGDMADQLRVMIYSEKWTLLPPIMLKLLPKVADIKITKMTRSESMWEGAYDRLMSEKPNSAN